MFAKLDEATENVVREATMETDKLLATSEKVCNEAKCLGSSDATEPPTRTPIGFTEILGREQQ